ncbi:helix-turn-helix domain-containing protein [Auritidibacter ignavus]|uniref:Helix-turn-helix domain-containing protein n=1 Tax=Auritidibacter ignavus TaxID=678932 RepID=A0AAJ6DCY0_9MICC|nr:helix-turn-helix domain-containing protein [Auritidibacter ignavus]NIH72249.1 excisionase family DNA binding protein [Auritidibacter ignavus]RMX23741.1 DNA-binding protein [Auritidibacter ignavus]WGH82500.1 helix-turn-helix domain-containing protein [Auritidibacter ignavus]WGH87065.1 helix-turn-helix domain-containing protein [Auritidibacter ignavus]WGH89349.1 helix-turn-helix domain-containing protein [Auritidibacter ignavus]
MTATLSPDLLEVRCYTVREVAEHLGTSPGFVYKEIHAGRLTAVNLGTGSKFRVRHCDLIEYLDSHAH